MCRVALASSGSCTQANGLIVGLDPTQVGCGRACTVWHLSVHVICLETESSVLIWSRIPLGSKPGSCPH
jgi:hypothetical protein